jgi:glyoxylase-like metal-dependent hydrolase (beta-lactamase superfamily II)
MCNGKAARYTSVFQAGNILHKTARSQTRRKEKIANKPTKESTMVDSYKAAPDIEVITSDFPIPGYGLVPINAFVIKGSEPILVDTGAAVHSKEFMPALQSVIDPADLKWLWLTHTDFDHIGCLHQLLAENPKLRVITTFLGVGIMSLFDPLPLDRVYLVNPGEKITVGNRTLTAVKPPAFDNPSTTGFYDDKSAAFFSSDCFGALLSSVPRNAAELSDADLKDGQVFWGTVDSPWLHKVDRTAFGKELDNIRRMAPKMVLSSHLPAAPGNMTDRLLASLAAVPGAQPFVGPNQAALEQMLKKMTEEPA